MSERAVGRRRHPEEVAGSAVLVGLLAAIPVAGVSLTAPLFLQTLADGAGLGEALGAAWITDGEDWEQIPLYLLGALLMAALCAVVASLTWSIASARRLVRPWVSRGLASAAAAAVPLLMVLVNPHWTLALLPAAAAGLITFVALPRVAYERT
ncbi:MAG TPA: hypothetical protein VGC37_09340 [Friedmanniella sp.]